MKRPTKITVIAITVIVFVVIVGVWKFHNSASAEEVSYGTAEVKRGDLVITVKATGTVEPEEVVDVGAQVAGRIIAFGKDEKGRPIDYGSSVEDGMVLAQIDDALFADEVAIAAAQLQQAKAKLDQAERDWARAQKLGPSEALAESSYDAYKYAYDSAKADVSLAEATLSRSKQNLDYCTIKSPVKGVIIDRRVNIGQTVVASLNAPSLFLIAKDLKRMQVWVSVNETDIGSIHPGQPVTFTVDAFPGEVFQGQVGKVRLNATMTQNVVTYTVEVITDNSAGRLLPYLTANAEFEVGRSDNVLLVPNGVLRWWPRSEQIAPKFRKALAESQSSENVQQPSPESGVQGIVWVQQDSYVRPINVQIGKTDGMETEVQGSELKEGLRVIVGEKQQQTNDSGTTNPFIPQIRRRRGG
jgi:HlyD family secretion protein